MQIKVITMWYNEALLAPFFLYHYSFADQIHLLLDTDTTDNTCKIAKQFNNVFIEPFTFPDMMDDELKVQKINKVAQESTNYDWIIAVDADEFIWPTSIFENGDFRNVLGEYDNSVDVFYAKLYQVYRHEGEGKLDPHFPLNVYYQRRFGDPNIAEGINKAYNKPCITKQGRISWSVDCHRCRPTDVPKISFDKTSFMGAHWAMADVNLAIRRRIAGRKKDKARIISTKE